MLHTYPYRETSLIVEAFTRGFGRVALVARGARRPRSAMRGLLQAFQPLRCRGRRRPSSSTLIAAEWRGALRPLRGSALMCGFYLNELLLRLLPREDPHEACSTTTRGARRGCRPAARRRRRCCAASSCGCSPSSAMLRCSSATPRAARRSTRAAATITSPTAVRCLSRTSRQRRARAVRGPTLLAWRPTTTRRRDARRGARADARADRPAAARAGAAHARRRCRN